MTTEDNKMNKENNKSSEKFEVWDNSKILSALTPEIIKDLRKNNISDVVNIIVGKLNLNKAIAGRLITSSLTLEEVNEVIDSDKIVNAVTVSEKIKEAVISSIAEDISAGKKNENGETVIPKIVFIAGPSSSGKTTLCKKMSYALEQQGLSPIMLSLDDYYLDYDHTPLDENGDYDFESLYALDLPLLQQHLKSLSKGEEVRLPRYIFGENRREWREETTIMKDDNILLIEGIHGLNPELCGEMDNRLIYRIYISGSALKVNKNGRYFLCTDNRLIRRLVRDYKYRKTSAQSTISRWQSVRRGEERWIVPYQKYADANINTSFPYEIGLLRHDARPLLKEVKPNEPEYFEAQRLLKLVEEVHPIDTNILPKYSILREFVGGSGYEE